MTRTIFQRHRRPFLFDTLLRSPRLCSIQMILNAAWPLHLQSKRAIILETLSVILYHFHSLSLSSEHCHQASGRKRLPYNSRCRGWGPHLGDIASLIRYCSWARSFLLYPRCGAYQKRKHCSCSWVSGMFNYLVKAQKGFQCPRIKVYHWGIGSHICKLCRCSEGVRTKTLMGVLLSRGWHFPPVSPGPDSILPIPIWSTDFCSCLSHPSIHLHSFTSDLVSIFPGNSCSTYIHSLLL